MIRTLQGWARNASDAAWLAFGDPLTAVVVVGLVALALWRHRIDPWSRSRRIAYGAFAVWLVAMLGITIFPIRTELDLNVAGRWEVQSIIPLAHTVESFGNMRDRIMTPDEIESTRDHYAEALGIPPEEVVVDPRIPGNALSTVLRDPVGNLFLFVPFGLLAPAALRLRCWRRVAGVAAAISGAIELSQLLFGLGSLGSIDDVIFNTAGALVGYGLLQLATASIARTGGTMAAA